MFLSIPCRKGAAKKLLTAVFLALVFLAPDTVFAQAAPGVAPGFTTLEEIYTVRNIAVDETADTASAARDIALSAARHTAFSRLTRRIVLPQDLMRVALPADDALTNLITDFEVADEKSRGQRYLAHLTMRFDPEKVRTLFRQSNIRHSETSAKSMLILPVYDGPAGRLLWEINIWRDALNAAVTNAGAADDRLAPLLLPLGDFEDVSAVSADQAVTGDMQRLGAMIRRYRVGGVLLMHAVQSQSQSATGGLAFDVTLRRPGAAEENVRIERFEGGPGEAAEQILQRASLMLVRGIQEEWLIETALDFSQQASLEVSAQLASLPDWLVMQKRLTDTPMIQRIDLRALSVTGAQVNLHFLGTPEKLASALSQHGLTLTQEAGYWQLR